MAVLLVSGCSKTDGSRLIQPDSFARSATSADTVRSENNSVSLDTVLFNSLQLHLAHNAATNAWPVKTDYPLPGALLPFNRIVAYYGNFYSKGMGILGELPQGEMLRRLQEEVKAWENADPSITVVPAIHYIAVTAQRNPGANAKYRLRMPKDQIELAIALAKKINGIAFLDVQVGHSTLEEELPALEPYLSQPNVHLGIDPEYSMKGGEVPCATIGTFDSKDVNYASSYLATLVRKYNIPPKILVVHRFTKEMLTNYRNVVTLPEVQIVISMDGFGFQAKKVDSYRSAVAKEPIQFTGFKIFYKNDILNRSFRLMQPEEILKLYPSPIYIQYQ